jgi:hypothetical protein
VFGFFGILVAMVLVIGGIETNRGPQMEEKMERLLDHMMAQREDGKRIREFLDKNKNCKILERNLVPK